MKTKQSVDYSWLLVAIVIGLAMLGACGCKEPVLKQEVAVFEGIPVVHDAEYETEAIFIPLDELSYYKQGQTVWIDTAGFITRPMLRDAETKQFVDPDLLHVTIGERIYPDKFIQR